MHKSKTLPSSDAGIQKKEKKEITKNFNFKTQSPSSNSSSPLGSKGRLYVHLYMVGMYAKLGEKNLG